MVLILKTLVTFFLIFLLNSQILAKDVKLQGSTIHFLDNVSPIYAKKILGNVEEFPYRNNRIIRILETFCFDNFGQLESRC